MSHDSRPVTGWALAATGAVLALAALVSVLLLSGPGTSRAADGPAAAARPATSTAVVSMATTRRGRILVGPGRHTLYAFSRDSRGHDRCQSADCRHTWPALVTSGRPRAGHGVRASLLGTITVHGARQVTYAGHPLYTFREDTGPAATEYIGVTDDGGRWSALTASGGLVH